MSDQLLVRLVAVSPQAVCEGVGHRVYDLPHVLTDGDQGELEASALHSESCQVVVSSEVNPHLSRALQIDMSTNYLQIKDCLSMEHGAILISFISRNLIEMFLLYLGLE